MIITIIVLISFTLFQKIKKSKFLKFIYRRHNLYLHRHKRIAYCKFNVHNIIQPNKGTDTIITGAILILVANSGLIQKIRPTIKQNIVNKMDNTMKNVSINEPTNEK